MVKLNKTISKITAALTPVYIHNTTNSNGISSIATNGLPSNGKNERRRRRRLLLSWRQVNKQTSKRKHTSTISSLFARRGRRFHAANSLPRRKRRRKR